MPGQIDPVSGTLCHKCIRVAIAFTNLEDSLCPRLYGGSSWWKNVSCVAYTEAPPLTSWKGEKRPDENTNDKQNLQLLRDNDGEELSA